MLDLLICLANREMKERVLLRRKAKAHRIYILQRNLYDEMCALREETRSFFESRVVNGRVDLFKHQLDLLYGKIMQNRIAMTINIYYVHVKLIDQKYRGWLTPIELYRDLTKT